MLEHTNTDALPHWGQSTHPVLTVSVNPCWIQICLWSVIFCGEAGHDLYSKGCPDTPTTPSANQREDCHHRVRTSLSSLSLLAQWRSISVCSQLEEEGKAHVILFTARVVMWRVHLNYQRTQAGILFLDLFTVYCTNQTLISGVG